MQSYDVRPLRGPASHGKDGFRYELSADVLRIGYRHVLLGTIPYVEVEVVERGWAPGWEAGGLGMPDRGDEVRIRVRSGAKLPWITVTPADPDAFVEEMQTRIAPWREALSARARRESRAG